MLLLSLNGRPQDQPVKIGVYDSRMVALAWSRSEDFQKHMASFMQAGDSASQAKNNRKGKEMACHAISYQHLLHQMVFGSGSIAGIMENIRKELPELAKREGVSMILSKYELPYVDPSVEQIDLTDEVTRLFKPLESIDQMTADMKKVEPMPLEELDIEIELLEDFCEQFGKK
jgi:hypothetical protein